MSNGATRYVNFLSNRSWFTNHRFVRLPMTVIAIAWRNNLETVILPSTAR
jgi:hypothetical protein